MPGQTVFENEDAYTTRSGSSESIVGSGSPLKRSSDVGVVLEHDEVVLGGEPEQRLALGQRQRVAGRVLKLGMMCASFGCARPAR